MDAPLLAPPADVETETPVEVVDKIAELAGLAALIMSTEDLIAERVAADDAESVHRMYNAVKGFRKQVDVLFDAAEQALAATVGKGTTVTPVGVVSVMQVADSKTADWPTILDSCESSALYDRETGEKVDDPAEAVHRLREIIEAVAPLTTSVMPRAALDSILDRREVVTKQWNGRFNVTAT